MGSPMGDEPKANKKRRKRPLPQIYSAKRVRLVKALTKANSIAHAGRLAGYGTKQAAHRALKQIRISSADALHDLGLRPHDWMIELAKVAGAGKFGEEYPDAGKKEQHVRASALQNEKIVKLYDPSVKMRACVELDKAYHAQDADDRDTTDNQSQRHSVCVVVSDPGAARAFAELFAPRGPTRLVTDLDAEVHEDMG